jgi:hypothetical protein
MEVYSDEQAIPELALPARSWADAVEGPVTKI